MMGYLEKKVGFASDAGNATSLNQDAIVCFTNDRSISNVEMIVGVADGMGGYNGGEVASNFVKEQLELFFKNKDTKKVSQEVGTDQRNYSYLFKEFIQLINKKLYEMRTDLDDVKNMGTTFTGVLGYEMDLYLAHIGDCRAYRVRSGKMECLTKDHTIGAKLENETEYPKEVSKDYFNILYRSLGQRPWTKVDFKVLKTLPNDFYFFCSDGLYNSIDETTILEQIIRNEYQPTRCCKELVNLAKEKGAMDNISAASILYINYMGLEVDNKDQTSRIDIR